MRENAGKQTDEVSKRILSKRLCKIKIPELNKPGMKIDR